MNLAGLPAGAPFLDAVAAAWLARGPDPLARGLILLPTRRAARGLAEAFLRAAGGRPMLLPRITAIGALDEAPLAMAGALALPPAVDGPRRLVELARLIMALPPGSGGVAAADRAWVLAGELAQLMDEAERAGLDLRAALARAAEEEHAAHWQVTLDFLAIVTEAWPAWLADQGLMNPAARQAALLRAQARAWEAAAPAEPVWAVGMTAALPAVGELLRAVARLPQGLVVLAGLDRDLPDALWQELPATHPQAGLRDLLAALGARRDDVAAWPHGDVVPPGRAALLGGALVPAAGLEAWRTAPPPEAGALWRLEATDQQEEAVAIAMILRDALEQPGRRAALVTPDRALAGRVAAELLRWGVLADDSAGERLAETPPAVFLRLLAGALVDGFGPVSLLALLKHPFAAAGLAPAACRAAARVLERACLRGPRPAGGLAGLRRLAEVAPAEAAALWPLLEDCLAPLLRLAAPRVAPAAMLAALVEAAEALAATDRLAGPAILWADEEGAALAEVLAAAQAVLDRLPDQPLRVLPGLLEALLEGQAVRSRRALRGRDGAREHPRVFVWGLLEARLQAVDLVVLGGLVEGVWPPATDPGPWLSRPMRARAGLPSPETAVGQAAHDFVAAACAAPVAVLSCPRRRDGAPAVPARWLARLEARLAGHGRTLPRHPAADWAGRLDQPVRVVPAAAPAPRPPVALRPRRLSVTEIETWLADPYAIHARHILRLRPLDPLEQETDAADYGRIVHAGLHLFLRDHGTRWPPRADERLRDAMERALAEAGLRPALAEWWRPRLARIADWVAATETVRRGDHPLAAVAGEVSGAWQLAIPGGAPFLLVGRADRIEQRRDGSLVVLDFKTGQLPSQKAVAAGFAPQLPLEAAMAEAGAFPGMRGRPAELVYWRLSGGHPPGEQRVLFRGDPAAVAAATAEARDRLAALVADFDRPERAYLARPHAARAPRFSDYAQLARVAEWAQDDDGEETAE